MDTIDDIDDDDAQGFLYDAIVTLVPDRVYWIELPRKNAGRWALFAVQENPGET